MLFFRKKGVLLFRLIAVEYLAKFLSTFRKVRVILQEINLDNKINTPSTSSFTEENPLCQRQYSYVCCDICRI